MIAGMMVFLLVYGRTNALSAADCSQVTTITQLSSVSLQCMISSNNTLEVYVKWKFFVSTPSTLMGVMTLDCGNIQRTIINQYTVISEGTNNVIGSYNVSLPSIPSECSVISCTLYGTRKYKLQIPTCTPLMSQERSTSISPSSIYSSVMTYTTSLLTVTDTDTTISSNTIANTMLPSIVSTDSTMTNVKLISTSITTSIKSVNITSNIQSTAVTTTIASNQLTTPNIEINSTKFASINNQSTNEITTIKLTSTKSVSATSVMKSVNAIVTTVQSTTSNIEVHSTKFSLTNIQSTSDASVISTESVRVTSTIIEFTFNHMSSSVVVPSSFTPSTLLEPDVTNRKWSTSISPSSIYSSVMPCTTSLLTVTDTDTTIPSNTIANTMLSSIVSTDSTITNVKLISTSITTSIELTSTIKSVNITSNIQSIAVTTTVASNQLTSPNIEINSTKFAFINNQSTNEITTIKFTSTKSVSATSVMKSVNTIITVVQSITSNIEVHSTKFSSTNIQSTSDASVISTEFVHVTSTTIEFTFNQMSSSIVVFSSSTPIPLFEPDVNNKSETLIAIICTVVVTVVMTIAIMSIVWMFSRKCTFRKLSLKQHKFDEFDKMWTPVLLKVSPSPSIVTLIAPLSPTFCDYLDVTKERRSNQYNDSAYATIQQNDTQVCTSASTGTSTDDDCTSYTISLSSGIYSDIQLYSPYRGMSTPTFFSTISEHTLPLQQEKQLSHSQHDLTEDQVTTDQPSSVSEKSALTLQDSVIVKEELPQSDSSLISVNSQSLDFSLKVQTHQTSSDPTKMSPLDMTTGGWMTETSHTLPKHANSDLSSSTEYDLKEQLPYIHTYYFNYKN